MRLPKAWFLLLAVCLISSCKTGPKVTFCVIDAPAMVLRCADPDGKPFDLELAKADSYGCMNQQDWENLLRDVAKSQAVKTAAKEVALRVSQNEYIKRKYQTVLKVVE